MRLSDIQHGKRTLVEVRCSGSEDFGCLTKLSKVEFFASEVGSEVLLRASKSSWVIEASDAHNRELLAGLMTRALPRVAWVLAREPQDEKLNATSLVIECREFPSVYRWPGLTEFGVDEKVVEAVRVKRRSLQAVDDVLDWLNKKLIINEDDGTSIILISGSPTPQADQRGAFRLYGQGWVADIARDPTDRLLVTRIVQSTHQPHQSDKRPILLIRGRFCYTDHTVAGQFRGTARSELDQFVAEAGSYLTLWNDYNELERRNITRRAQEFGWLSYHSRRQLPDGRWRFQLQDSERLNDCMRSLEEGEVADLEAATSLPPEFFEATDGEEREKVSGKRGRVFAGECTGHDRQALTIDLRPSTARNEEGPPPPESGVLFISLSGDRARLDRRMRAQVQIAAAECPMPQLGLLIEGKAVPTGRRRREKALSKAAREAFGGEPTGRQIEALRVALNTPDIALIQGPPGTGKTRTIAALQARLSEIAEDTDQVAGRYLLTSYQHDAVENVASATQVFGLPAIKVGRKRDQLEVADGFERWRLERADAVRATLSGLPELPASEALRRCRDLAVGYLEAPSRAEDITRLLREVHALALQYVPPEVSDRLLELCQSIETRLAPAEAGSGDLGLALKAVRGLRCSEAAFSDDGDIKARKALSRLQRLSFLAPEEEALLEKASAWDVDLRPDFLAELEELQAKLIDKLTPDERPVDAPLINEDVELALGSTIDALREVVRSSQGGVGAVLHEFLDDLEHDHFGTRDAIEQYTVVLAATCQQAVGAQMRNLKGPDTVFDTVVVDEAARANPLDLFIPMALAERRIVLVGDHRQLPHMLDQEIEHDLDTDVSEKTQAMLKTSLFERLFAQLRERERSDGIKRTVTLDVQYRMHPVLGDFVSDTFYKPHGEAFTSGRKAEEFPHGLGRYSSAVAAWVDIPLGRGSERSGRSKSRPAEARWVAQEAQRIMEERPELSVGVISFYSAQVQEILREMEPLSITGRAEGGSFQIRESWKTTRGEGGKLVERLRVGTVDSFQGKEFDVVILSMTRSNDMLADTPRALRQKYGHLMLENRLCVAMSRQKRLLIVAGDSGMLSGDDAAQAIPGLVGFLELCKGEHGVQLHA